jgi:hypothetical protein
MHLFNNRVIIYKTLLTKYRYCTVRTVHCTIYILHGREDEFFQNRYFKDSLLFSGNFLIQEQIQKIILKRFKI